VNLSQSYDWFSDHRSPLGQTSLSLRAPTPLGPVVATLNRASQYGLGSYQTELEAYPHLRPQAYAHLEFGYSADGNLYPGYRGAADFFQGVGHGFEMSGGYWRLQFSTGFDVYTFALAKYHGNWLFTGRGFLTPSGAGTTGTALVSARRFFGSEGRHDYLEVAYTRGASPALATTIGEAQVLDSSRFIVTYDKVLHRKWVLSGTGFIGQERQTGLPDYKRYSFQGSVYYRF
jgi:YaiO family outer membrane protein